MKLSWGKLTLPGLKQVFRQRNSKGQYVKDIIALHEEKVKGEPLLKKVMQNGQILADMPTLKDLRTATAKNLADLHQKHKKLTHAPTYPVELSPRLRRIKKELTRQLKRAKT